MPSLTIKNIPDALYVRLKHMAEANHRSMNGQAIASLEDALKAPKSSTEEWLAGVDAIRHSIAKTFKAADIDQFKRAGRK
jgi:antitoxin FitA